MQVLDARTAPVSRDRSLLIDLASGGRVQADRLVLWFPLPTDEDAPAGSGCSL